MTTVHRQFHLDALKRTAEEIQDPTEKSRILSEVADAERNWPDEFLDPSDIHDWIEKPGRRKEMQEVLDKRKVEASRG